MTRVFVVGCPRSGTTLVQSLLSAHPAVVSFPETHFFTRAVSGGLRGRLGLASARAPQAAAELPALLGREGTPPRAVTLRTYARWFAAMLDDTAAAAGVHVWVEKTPDHVRYIDEIERYLQDARFVHVLRDGADTVASLYEVTREHPDVWEGAWSLDKCLDRWLVNTAATHRHEGRENHFVVRYEELIAGPEPILRELCGFVGIEFDPAMLERRSGEAIAHPWESWKQTGAGPLVDTRGRKFATVLDEDERRYVLERIAR